MVLAAGEGSRMRSARPKPLHRLEAYRHYPVVDNGIPVTDQLAQEVISLPMHAYLDVAAQDRVIETVRAALKP